MSGVYRDCENCEIRKAVARAFDLHWMGEDDCPWQLDGNCPSDKGG